MTIAQMLYSFRLWRIIIYFYHHPCLENKNKAVCIGKNRECRNRVFYSSGARPWTPHANRCKLPAVRQRMGSGARMPGRNGTGQVALWKVGIQGSKWWNAVGLLTKVFETEKCIASFGWYTFLFLFVSASARPYLGTAYVTSSKSHKSIAPILRFLLTIMCELVIMHSYKQYI